MEYDLAVNCKKPLDKSLYHIYNIITKNREGDKGLRFQWDENKNESNIVKHGVSFDEASTVFDDEEAIFISDPDHSVGEERFLLLGLSSREKILVVCHCYRENDEVIRIISARPATKNEKRQYNERIGGL